MFANFSQIFKPANKDLRRKIYFTFLCLFVFKLGTTIVVPGIDKNSLGTNSLGFLELMNLMGGGALEQFSIFALGVTPYITASIVMQLLQATELIPYLTDLANQGGTGRNKLNKITRYVGIAFAFVQGYMFSFAFVKNGSPTDYMQFALILTAGTSLLLWIGDQITQKGVGNGISLIIMAGIIANLPNMFMTAWDTFVTGSTTQAIALGVTKFSLFTLLYIAIIIGVVYVESAERRIPIQYTNKTISGSKQSYVPFKLNSSGVMPVIFASALMSIPSIFSTFIKNEGFQLFVNKYLTTSTTTGFIIYIVSIFLFSYFYAFYTIKPKEMAENVNKNGGFIPGIRPGEETVNYVSAILKRITTVGAAALAFIAALPIIFGALTDLPSSMRIGGTGLIIVVGVALETYKSVDSELKARKFARGRK